MSVYHSSLDGFTQSTVYNCTAVSLSAICRPSFLINCLEIPIQEESNISRTRVSTNCPWTRTVNVHLLILIMKMFSHASHWKRHTCGSLTSCTNKLITAVMWRGTKPTFDGLHCSNNICLVNCGPPVRVDTPVLCIGGPIFRQCVQRAAPPFTLCNTTRSTVSQTST